VRLDPLGLIGLLLSAALLLLIPAGLSMMEAGIVRPKNAASIALTKLTDTIVAWILYWACGYAFMFGTSAGGILGTNGFFMRSETATIPDTLARTILIFLFCATAVTIVTGAVAERVSFLATVVLTAVFAGLVFPLYGHWAWGGGFLMRAGFFDAAGATTVHALGGAMALGGLLAVGNRTGRYTRRGGVIPFAGSSVPLATLGFFLLWLGFLGWTAGAAGMRDMWGMMPRVVLDTILSGAAGGIAALAAAWARRGLPDWELFLRGGVAGLVAVTGGCPLFTPVESLFVGAVAAIVMLVLDELLARLRIDDAVGAVPVHLGGGAWGTIVTGIFGWKFFGRSAGAQIGLQLYGLAIAAAWGFGVAFVAFRLWALAGRLRVTHEEEFVGLSVTEHQAGTELMDLMDALEEAARHETPEAGAAIEPFAEIAHVGVDDGGTITYTNPIASAIFGYAETEFRRVPAAGLFAGAAVPPGIDETPREVAGVRRTGEELPLEVWRGTTTLPGAETTIGVLCLKDITSRKEKEEGRNRPPAEIRRRFEREIADTPVVRVAPEPHQYVLGSEVAAVMPAGAPTEWFGYLRDDEGQAITFFCGEVAWQPASAVSLLTGVVDDRAAAEDTHGLYLGGEGHPPERQLRNLAEVVNRIVLRTGRGEVRVAMELVHVDLKAGGVRFLGAGMPTPIFWKSGRAVKEVGGGAGTPFGVSYEPEFDLRSLKLVPGDMLMAVTGGLVDTYTPEGKLFRSGELKKIFAAHRDVRQIRDEMAARTRAVWKDRANRHAIMVFQWNG
jgi:ammonium transporter